MFKVATQALKWSPSDFWRATPREFWAGIEASEEAAAEIERVRQQARQG